MESKKYKVTFMDKLNKNPEAGEVIIYSIPSSWNDFSYKIRCGYSFYDNVEQKKLMVKCLLDLFHPTLIKMMMSFFH